jgi:hypothetical protein
MHEARIILPGDGQSCWAGMGDIVLVSPDGRREVVLRYAGEPPFGDSYHQLEVEGARLPGFAWGCNFAFSPDSRFLAASWMAKLYERRTAIVDVEQRRFCVLSAYLYDFAFDGTVLTGVEGEPAVRFDPVAAKTWTSF